MWVTALHQPWPAGAVKLVFPTIWWSRLVRYWPQSGWSSIPIPLYWCSFLSITRQGISDTVMVHHDRFFWCFASVGTMESYRLDWRVLRYLRWNQRSKSQSAPLATVATYHLEQASALLSEHHLMAGPTANQWVVCRWSRGFGDCWWLRRECCTANCKCFDYCCAIGR